MIWYGSQVFLFVTMVATGHLSGIFRKAKAHSIISKTNPNIVLLTSRLKRFVWEHHHIISITSQ